MDMIDIRRLFRNRFEDYIINNDSRCVGVRDGAIVTLQQLCEILRDDVEEFPSRFDPDMKKFCGHEHLTYFRRQRTYGDVARLLDRKLAGEAGRLPPVGGRWVHAVLKEAYPPSP